MKLQLTVLLLGLAVSQALRAEPVQPSETQNFIDLIQEARSRLASVISEGVQKHEEVSQEIIQFAQSSNSQELQDLLMMVAGDGSCSNLINDLGQVEKLAAHSIYLTIEMVNNGTEVMLGFKNCTSINPFKYVPCMWSQWYKLESVVALYKPQVQKLLSDTNSVVSQVEKDFGDCIKGKKDRADQLMTIYNPV